MDGQTNDRAAVSCAIGNVLPHSPFVPYDPEGPDLYQGVEFTVPCEYLGWRDETMSWKETCYLHGNLNPISTFRIKGFDAIKPLSDTCVNTVANFLVGTGCIPC